MENLFNIGFAGEYLHQDRYSADSAGPAPFKSDKIYVEQGIIDYARGSGLDVDAYCKSLEPRLKNLNPQFIPYNSRDCRHVNDVINEGYYLLTTTSHLAQAVVSVATHATSHWSKAETPGNDMIPVSLNDYAQWEEIRTPADDRKNLLDSLQKAGIMYSKTPWV